MKYSILFILFYLISIRLIGQSDTVSYIKWFNPDPPGSNGNFIIESEMSSNELFINEKYVKVKCKDQWIYDTTGIYRNSEEFFNTSSYILECYSCYYENGEMAYVIYVNNSKLNGPSMKFYNTGQINTLRFYLLGVPTGKYLEYYPDGVIKISGAYCFKDEFFNKNESYIIIEHDENTLETKTKPVFSQIEYKEGIWKYYNHKGILIKEESYFCGNKNGEWKYYDENEHLISSEIWENNKLIERH